VVKSALLTDSVVRPPFSGRFEVWPKHPFWPKSDLEPVKGCWRTGGDASPVQISSGINGPVHGRGMLKLGEIRAAMHPYP
jgi:hypothetical protein